MLDPMGLSSPPQKKDYDVKILQEVITHGLDLHSGHLRTGGKVSPSKGMATHFTWSI